jgi:uncharacterized protein YggU (UPF0235/DUF167 family)
MYVKVQVTAGAKRELVEQAHDSRLLISVKDPPKQNLANTRVIELVAHHFGVTTKKVRIINGHHSPSKMISVDV